MTKYFEVVRRDGPARMGKLLLERSISTPGFITSDDYITAGSIFGYASVDEAISAHQELEGQKKLAILPYVPAALHSEPTLELPPMETDGPGPKGVLVHPFSERKAGKCRRLCAGQCRDHQKSTRPGEGRHQRKGRDSGGYRSLCSGPRHACQSGPAGVPGNRSSGQQPAWWPTDSWAATTPATGCGF